VGDRYVLEALQRHGWTLGGEGSGHLLILDKHTTGDALVSALQVLEGSVRRGVSLADRLQSVQLYPQVLVNVRMAAGTDWRANARLAETLRAAELALGDAGRVLIRASGTEPVLRVMVEAEDAAKAQHWATQLAAQVGA
jgi:phosphoglucosamine mutase